MENFTMVETGKGSVRKTAIAIRPFFDSRTSNMGLEEYGMTLFDGVTHTEQLACLENNGVTRYITGLNEYAPEIKLLNAEEKEARVRQIREAITELEMLLVLKILISGIK
jgi:hypothetical protein